MTSATARARAKHAPDLDSQLLRRMEHTLRLLFWAETEDAKRNKNRPEPISLPGDTKAQAGKKRGGRDLDARLAARQAARQAELAQMNGEGS